MNKNIKESIDSRLTELQVSEDFSANVFSALYSRRRRNRMRKPFIPVVCACLCILMAIPALGAAIPSFNALIAHVSPEFARFLQPVELSCENNGIKMDVLGAMNDEETTIVYMNIQDLTGDRVDKDIELSAGIGDNFTFRSQVVGYDEATKTATVCLLSAGGKDLVGKEITVAADSILSKKQVLLIPDIAIAQTLTAIPETVYMERENITGGGGLDSSGSPPSVSGLEVLKPDVLNLPIEGVDYAEISNAGFIDGKLHIQVKTGAPRWRENQHYFRPTLTDAVGNDIPFTSVYFEYEDEGRYYEEFMFEVSSPSGYAIGGRSLIYNTLTEGEWKTSFKLEGVKDAKKSEANINLGSGCIVSGVYLSPLEISVSGVPGSDKTDLDLVLTLSDGTSERYTRTVLPSSDASYLSSHDEDGGKISVMQSSFGEDFSVRFFPSSPMDISKIKSVTINGNAVNLK